MEEKEKIIEEIIELADKKDDLVKNELEDLNYEELEDVRRTVFEGMMKNNIRIVGNGKGSGGGEDNEDLDDILENILENLNL